MYCHKCSEKFIDDVKFCHKCCENVYSVDPKGENSKKNSQKKKHLRSNLFLGIFIGMVTIFFLAFLLIEAFPEEGVVNESISASVVNVFCPIITEDGDIGDNSSGGSGTILSSDGLVITNSHIIPQDEENLYVSEQGCLVVLPDPLTGSPSEIYWAQPIVIPLLSDEYDLAFLFISEPFQDEEGVLHGQYLKDFSAISLDSCIDETIRLGEHIRILGYPSSSGGNFLTVTEGVVSSFPGDGLILTSAKVDSGNSGGLAIDRYGCMIGIPSSVTAGEYNNLGVIISSDLITEFINRLSEYVE